MRRPGSVLTEEGCQVQHLTEDAAFRGQGAGVAYHRPEVVDVFRAEHCHEVA